MERLERLAARPPAAAATLLLLAGAGLVVARDARAPLHAAPAAARAAARDDDVAAAQAEAAGAPVAASVGPVSDASTAGRPGAVAPSRVPDDERAAAGAFPEAAGAPVAASVGLVSDASTAGRSGGVAPSMVPAGEHGAEQGDERADDDVAPAEAEAAGARVAAPIAAGGVEGPEGAVPQWLAPVNGRITQRFGDRDDGTLHDAVDLAVPMGTEVLAPVDLRIDTIGWQRNAGRYIIAYATGDDGKERWRLTFAHLSHVEPFEGQHVARGEVLGLTGISGHATGPHLHFRIERVGANGRTPLDPLPFIGLGEGAHTVGRVAHAP